MAYLDYDPFVPQGQNQDYDPFGPNRGSDYDSFGPNLEQNQYKGFVPLVGGNLPSNFFTPIVNPASQGFVQQSGSGSGSRGHFGTGFTTSPEEQQQYDFPTFTGKNENVKEEVEDYSQVPLPVKPTQAQVSNPVQNDDDGDGGGGDVYGGEDTLGTGQTASIDETLTDFLDTIGNPFGFGSETTTNPTSTIDTVGTGFDTFTNPTVQGLATEAAKGAVLGFAQGALGINAPLGMILGAISGISSTISHQEALQNIVDLEAQAWGMEKGRSIGFFDALGSYFFGQNQLTTDEQEMDFFHSQEYGAKGALHGFPVDPEHSAKNPITLYVELMQPIWDEEEAAHDAPEASGPDSEVHGPDDDIDPGTFGAFLGEGQTITEAIEAAEATTPFGQTTVSQAPAHGAESELGDSPSDGADQGGHDVSGPSVGAAGTGEDVGADQGSPPSSNDDDSGNGDDPGDDSGDDPGGGGPCWVAGTQILMEDGSCKNIENLKIGDMVMSFPENSKIRRWNTSLEAKPIIDLLVSKADIWHLNDSMVSENEWMVKSDGTASLVQWLNVGDELMDQDGNKVKVYRNEPAEGKLSRQVVYNFESENNYSYIANNMRTLKGKAVRMAESKMNSFGEGYFSDESNNMKQGWSMQDEYKRKFGN